MSQIDHERIKVHEYWYKGEIKIMSWNVEWLNSITKNNSDIFKFSINYDIIRLYETRTSKSSKHLVVYCLQNGSIWAK